MSSAVMDRSIGDELIDAYRERGNVEFDVAWIRSGALAEDDKLALGLHLQQQSRHRRLRFGSSGEFSFEPREDS